MPKSPPIDSKERISTVIQYATKTGIQVTYDALALIFAFEGALLLRLPFSDWLGIFPTSIAYTPAVGLIGLGIFWTVGFYRTLWRYASVDAIWLITATSFLTVGTIALMVNLLHPHLFPWSIYFIMWMLLSLAIGSGRMTIRYLCRRPAIPNDQHTKRILIYGAGDAGEMIARDIVHDRGHNFNLVGFIDDDTTKMRKSLHGKPIFGGINVVRDIVEQKLVEEVVIAIPSLSGIETRELLRKLKILLDNRAVLRTIPPISELVGGQVTVGQIRDFDVRDLLRRDPVELDSQRVNNMLKGRSIMVTGAGGSIGSEICRQVAICDPSKLILFDISEPNLYQICDSLQDEFPLLTIVPVVGDIGHRWLVERVFEEHSPRIVFHAAAYKHVPLMEDNPLSAIVNNVIGTRVLAAVSSEFEVERLVMISTDKAVRPTNMMGASKRLCEMLVQAQPHSPGTIYCAVRFGNVMGSSGSVIPKFERQIAAGGPVTVTHPETTRYFMLTSEAVQLVLQAASLDAEYSSYFLDMGDPVKIADLAYDIISLHGLTPGKDIEIVYTDLRPGEKVHEELSHSGEGKPTIINKIWIAETPQFNPRRFLENLDDLLESCYTMDRRELYLAVAKLIPDFQPATESLDPKAFQIGGQSTQIHSQAKSRH
jgi:FlaA1/EpsC-like NDP-sugar epimerase